MAYGDYDGPKKPNKGHEGGACNRTLCQAEPALWYNHGSLSWYCADCARDIGQDSFNLRDWNANYLPRLGHPMFETREMMDARKAAEAVPQGPEGIADMVIQYIESAERDEYASLPRNYHRDTYRPADLYGAKKSRR